VDRDFEDEGGWRRVPGTVNSHVSFFRRTSSSSSSSVPWHKAVATIDAPAAAVLAWLYLESSRDKNAKHEVTEGDLPKDTSYEVQGTRSTVSSWHVRFPQPLKNRKFATWSVHDSYRDESSKDEGYVFAVTDLHDYDDAHPSTPHSFRDDPFALSPLFPNFLLASYQGVSLVKILAPDVCQLTFIQKVDLKGSLPALMVNHKTKMMLGVVADLRVKNQRRGRAVDAEIRDAFAAKVLKYVSPHLILRCPSKLAHVQVRERPVCAQHRGDAPRRVRTRERSAKQSEASTRAQRSERVC
jgi:hypothetical protein